MLTGFRDATDELVHLGRLGYSTTKRDRIADEYDACNTKHHHCYVHFIHFRGFEPMPDVQFTIIYRNIRN